MDWLDDLNNQQRHAVEGGDGPVLIVAGPGTGKTKTLTARIGYIVAHGLARPDEILALTFTTKAAREMAERVASLSGVRPHILTFHALGSRLIQASEPGKELRLISEPDRTALIRTLPKPAALKGVSNRELALGISRYKGLLEPSADASVACLVRAYDAALAQQNLVDFDDLILRAYRLLCDDADARLRLIGQYRYILIDEFQDTSELQWALVQQLRTTDNIFVIGDPKQAIYGFRGAGAEMFGRFRRDFPAYQRIVLDTNYRSARSIVSLANAVFPAAEGLQPFVSAGGQVRAVQTLNEYSEADLVLRTVEEGIGGSDMLTATTDAGDRRFGDFAVLYRTHQAAKAVQQRLRDSGIPYQVVGEGSPYEQPEIQAVIGALRWLHDGQAVPVVKGLSEAQVAVILGGLDAAQPVSQLAQAIIAALALDGEDTSKRQRLAQFVGTLVRFDDLPDGVAAFLHYADDLAHNDFYDPAADAVTLLTIHAAKGLEFVHVMVIAAEDGMLPHIRKTAEPDFDEERRLFYVAVTRAKQQLDIFYAKRRAGEDARPSRFMAGLSDRDLPRSVDGNLANLEKKLYRRQQKARQATLF